MVESSSALILRTEHLSQIFRSGGEEIVVFEDLNLEIQEGEIVALVGESGTGKTTLLHLLAALDTPARGEVYFRGQRLSEFGSEERAAYRNVRVGLCMADALPLAGVQRARKRSSSAVD